MESVREVAQNLLREYRRTHRQETDSPVMRALQARDDQATQQIFDFWLTQADRAFLSNFRISI
jgi:hypothetical protein